MKREIYHLWGKKLVISLLASFILHVSAMAQTRTMNMQPEVQADNSVIFRIKAPEAKKVMLLGTWPPSKYGFTIPMEKKDSIFEVKVGPLPSAMYEYRYLIDGLSTTEPGSSLVTRDGIYVENRLMVPGPQAD